MSSEDDVRCDSLSGAALFTRAGSVSPNPSAAGEKRRARWAVWLLAGAWLGVAGVFAATRGVAQPPLPDAQHLAARAVSDSAAFAAAARMRTLDVRELSLSPIVFAIGNVGFEPEQVAAVGANALGIVRRVAKYEGDSVKRGEVLAEIGSAVEARREAAGALRAQQLPQRVLGVSLLRSPLDGTIVERRIVTGQSVRGERVVFVVANLDRLTLTLNIDEAQARRLLVGDRVELAREASSDVLGAGSVTAVEPLASAEPAPTLRVSIGVDNRARHLRAGQAVSARIFASL